MKRKIHIKILCILLLTPLSFCFGQNNSSKIINKIKENDIARKEGLVWYDGNNIIRANFDEKYKSTKFSNPKDIAIEYLKLKHRELGLDKELKGIELVNSLKSGNRENFYFEQYYNDIPIYGTEIIVTVDTSNTVAYVLNNCMSLQHIQRIHPDETIGEKEALEIALENLGYDGKDVDHQISKVYAELENEELMLCWKLYFKEWVFLISAVDGEILKKGSTILEADIQTKVFSVNPLYTAGVSYGTTGYTDNYDQPSTQLNAELTGVILDDVFYCWALGKQGYSNEYCYVVNIAAPNTEYDTFYNDYPLSNTDAWYNNMDRGDDMFEVAMVLYHIDKAGKWVESLGYSPDEVCVDPHGSYEDGAWADLAQAGADEDHIRFGIGGVDLAEDQTVIWHEYGHHVNYSLHPNQSNFYDHFYDLPVKSVMEGFSDYFAASYKNTINGWDPATIAEWGRAEHYMAYPEERRRTDTDNTYPDDYGGNSHLNGQIFSSALMDVEDDIGRFATNKILLKSINDWGVSPTLPSAGENFINAAEDLYGKEYLCECVSNLKSHGLTQRPYSQDNRYVHDETIQSSITYNDACSVTFENVVIDNSPNINVVVEPISGETTIVKSFEVKLGSTFEIK